MVNEPIQSLASTEKVENVFLFISDAMRYDYLPDELRNLGVTARAIAPSTFTASALPSLCTGKYPSTHRVWTFDDVLAERPPLFESSSHDFGFNAESVWIDLPPDQKPPLRIHRLSEERTLSDLSNPYVYVHHDVGPHAPYGVMNDVYESTEAFFAENDCSRENIASLYKDDCANSAERFLHLYDQMKERGELEETLIVFTSDHGEALGERRAGGRFGHGHPMVPETVDVPIVFAGAGLPGDRQHGRLLSGVDIAPTFLSALGLESSAAVDGVDLWQTVPEAGRRVHSEVWQHLDIEL
jgi:hypothetical protein